MRKERDDALAELGRFSEPALYILISLAEGPKHGYAITRDIEEVAGQKLDVFIAGDDADAKAKVAQIVTDGGMRAIDAGPLSRARQIEGMQLLHIVLQGSLGTNWASTLKIIS